MKKSVSILFIVSMVLTVVGAVSMVFSRVTSLLFTVGLSLGFGAVMYNILGQKERNRIPKWLNVLLVLSFVPIILCFYWAINAGIHGVGGSFIFPEKHGWSAFSETLLITIFLLTVIPFIPVSVIVQVNFIKLKIKLRKKEISERS